MKTVIWIIQIIVTVAFLAAGVMKFVTPYADMAADPNMQWVHDFSSAQIKIISALEVVGALGLILPMILRRFKILVPIAAVGLAIIMCGALITHILRGEPVIVNVVLFILAIITAWGRREYFRQIKN